MNISPMMLNLSGHGFIANKKGVEPIVPELYAIIDEMVEAGK